MNELDILEMKLQKLLYNMNSKVDMVEEGISDLECRIQNIKY